VSTPPSDEGDSVHRDEDDDGGSPVMMYDAAHIRED
jgi:hypothetical protein